MMVKRIICLLCAVLLVLAATGCGGPASNQADTDAVIAAVDKFRACKSFALVQLTEIEESYTLDGEEMLYTGTTQMEMELVAEPAFQMKTATSSNQVFDGEQSVQTTLSYIVPENGGYTEYFNDGLEWYKVSTEIDVSLIGIGASSIADTFFIDNVGFRKAAEESLDSGKAVRYDGQLGGEALLAMMEANGLLSSVSSMSENQQAKIRENLLKDLNDVTLSIWVDAESGYPVRFEVSVAKMLKELDSSIAKTLGNKTSNEEGSLNKYVISMSLSNFDALEQISLPSEAANAKPYEDA